ncbi:Tylosin resistance ATP-binding protein TlrC [Seminavis robusta]|uniref:Tylosin resistance ATP-binding protein TlrC n=1 Tax=Seminavis robusta TaxID=568900 RepID=A0A9N8EQ68_9STRA|nr:Tylosin resistance ATP-binding protein TlrC [Seminavis robusta]|eukprot:Sro1378_g267610.1 Tylosin resistance ATP-binding protein TlrC (403) ;mRNA; r:8144-9352
MQNKPTRLFSGGWRMRISLARALFLQPKLLMLDEPTNHLDLNAVIWLDDYLQALQSTLLIVSHDQAFLNGVCQEILHIEDKKLLSYKGNYDTFKREQTLKFQKLSKAWNAQRKQGSKTKGGGAELVKRPRDYRVYLEFADVPSLRGSVLDVTRASFRYSGVDPIIFRDIDFSIGMESRICVAGLNGTGKSTLIKMLTGQVVASKGEVRRNPRLRLGTFNQHASDVLPGHKTPTEFLRERHKEEGYQDVCKILGTFGLGRHAHEIPIRDLSGGQKARVVFADLTLEAPHILLLDEPTNNLDLETIDALVEAINAFNGGLVVVTHDQRLIDACNCELWVVGNQKVEKWKGNFEDYKAMMLSSMKLEALKQEEAHRKKQESKAAERAKKLKGWRRKDSARIDCDD